MVTNLYECMLRTLETIRLPFRGKKIEIKDGAHRRNEEMPVKLM